MNTISSNIIASQAIVGDRVDREIVLEVRAFGVKQAEADAVARFTREHPEAKVEVIAHQILARFKVRRTWTEFGTYHVTLRARGLLENLS